jgi:transposase
MLTTDAFLIPLSPTHRQYEALRAHYVEGKTPTEAAAQFGYTLSAYYALMHELRHQVSSPEQFAAYFFAQKPRGRKPRQDKDRVDELIGELRKKYLSVPDIKALLDTLGFNVSETYVFKTLKRQGFARLPRRPVLIRQQSLAPAPLKAPASTRLDFTPETFTTQDTLGLLCLLPYLQRYEIDQLIAASTYPETRRLDRLSSILSFVALKLAHVRRYSHDDSWCMDRGLGLLAGLNVLPKAAWFTSYSHRVTRAMNLQFLKSLHQVWVQHGLLSDTANLDFTTLPYWGEDTHLENNWSGSRHQALASLLAVLGQDPDSGILTYGDTTIRHQNKAKVVLEFLDFYATHGGQSLHYLVFDSQFTTYQNLRQLDQQGVKFITIRRRGKNIVAELAALPPSQWRQLRVADSSGKGRVLSVAEQTVTPRDYGKALRQVAIAGRGRIQPALIITNDFELACEQIVRKYARRWLVEKGISQQIEFFHLNRVSSCMVIKVDFDLTMTILAHNLLRLLAAELPGYTHLTPASLFTRFLQNSGRIHITPSQITIALRKKRHLPALLSAMEPFNGQPCRLCNNLPLIFSGDCRS